MKTKILERLKQRPMRVVELCMSLGVDYRGVEKPLQQLRKDGSIRFDKKLGWQIAPESDGCDRAHACDEAGLHTEAADRETSRADAAEARAKELEAQCAAMREALVVVWSPFDKERKAMVQAALSGDAGRAMLERVEALDLVATSADMALEYGWSLDCRKALRERLDALEAKR